VVGSYDLRRYNIHSDGVNTAQQFGRIVCSQRKRRYEYSLCSDRDKLAGEFKLRHSYFGLHDEN
jgi:hypothetical protein